MIEIYLNVAPAIVTVEIFASACLVYWELRTGGFWRQ